MAQRKICTKHSLAVCIAAGAALAELRLKGGYTTRYIASATGISHKTVYDIEHARTGTDLNKLMLMLDFYGLTLGQFAIMIRDRIVYATRIAEVRLTHEDD